MGGDGEGGGGLLTPHFTDLSDWKRVSANRTGNRA